MIAPVAATALQRLLQEDSQYRRTAKGLARSLVWREGVPPPELGEHFGPVLTQHLLTQSDRALLSSLWLIESQDPAQVAIGRTGLQRAAEAYESLLSNGDPADPRRALNRILAAASYHLSGYAASAYSLLRTVPPQAENDTMLMGTSLVLERRFDLLDDFVGRTAGRFYGLDGERVAPAEHELAEAVEQHFVHCVALFLSAMRINRRDVMDESLRRIDIGERVTLASGDVWSRLIFGLLRPLVRELWTNSVMNAIPRAAPAGVEGEAWLLRRSMLGRVLVSRKLAELELWPSQLVAAQRVFADDLSFAAALPTSAGKTRLAELAAFKSLMRGQRVVYITPLRALSAQVERGFRRLFGPLSFTVSALYGAQGVTPVDRSTFEAHDIVVATPEKAGFALRNAPEVYDNVGLVILDESHLVGSESRGVAYEGLVIALKRRPDHAARRFLALSALLPEHEPSTGAFARWISDGAVPAPVGSPTVGGQAWRPTRQCFGMIAREGDAEPLGFTYSIDVGGEISWLKNFVVQQTRRIGTRVNARRVEFPADRNDLALASADKLLASQKSVLIYCPLVASVDAVCNRYLAALNHGFLHPFPIAEGGQAEIDRAVRVAEEVLPHGSNIIQALRAGLAVHHGQLPRAFLRELDRLISLSVVRVVVASPTVNAGLNIAATCVLFNGFGRGMERFQRFNGQFSRRLAVLEGAETLNVAGRAGRAFVDTHGEVLGVCFDAAQVRHWVRLRQGMLARSFTSGLAAVLDRLITLLEGDNIPAETVRAMIAENADGLWNQPPVADQGLAEWARAVRSLDQALLAFVDNPEGEMADLAAQLDTALAGSFFRAAIQNLQREATYLVLVHSRGRALWGASTPAQRKGWYFAGVGLDDGHLLDEKAEVVAPLIAQVEVALALFGADDIVPRLIEIGGHLFQIPCFTPQDGLPEGWDRILRQWLEGMPLQLIFAGPVDAEPSDADYRAAGHFIEDGVVYRLTWALEAVRVRRPELIDDDEGAPRRGLRCAAFLEAGTLDSTVAVLLQLGLPSRRVAQEVVAHEELDIFTAAEVRAWVRAQRHEPPDRWDYLDAAILPIWTAFIAESDAVDTRTWELQTADSRVDRHYFPPSRQPTEGILYRVLRGGRSVGEFRQMDGTPLAALDWPFGGSGPPVAEATLYPDDRIVAAYLGPRT